MAPVSRAHRPTPPSWDLQFKEWTLKSCRVVDARQAGSDEEGSNTFLACRNHAKLRRENAPRVGADTKLLLLGGLGTEKYLPPPPREQEKKNLQRKTLASSTPTVDMEML